MLSLTKGRSITSRFSRPGPHYGFSEFTDSSAAPAAELCRSAAFVFDGSPGLSKPAMSFVHPIIVGHFDMAKSNIRDRVVTRAIDEVRAESLLAKYQLPVGEEVWFRDGYLECRCTLFSESMMGFVRAIAECEDCYAIEVSQWEILHRPT